MGYTRADWSAHFSEGRDFRQLGDDEKRLIAEHAPPPAGGRALDACCGTGELAAFLATLGYTVDATDFAEGALARARAERSTVEGVRWLCLDVEEDDPADLHEDGYDVVTLRMAVAFVRDRCRVLRGLGARLRENGTLIVITPVVERTPEERRHIALDEDELVLLTEGFEEAVRFDAAGMAVLVLRKPGGSFASLEKGRPGPQAVAGAAAVVTDPSGRVLLGRSVRNMWEVPGGRIETGESAQAAAVREPAKETGLAAREEDAHVLAVLHDDRADVRRITVVVRITAWEGLLGLPEPHRFLPLGMARSAHPGHPGGLLRAHRPDVARGMAGSAARAGACPLLPVRRRRASGGRRARPDRTAAHADGGVRRPGRLGPLPAGPGRAA
ncbi:bifunctional class I SAM-dependent methyltransferase/NUDIX hydrolase [Streptomyces nitrosporeus]|uniref:bifunctional class I SAM-dependent methyltransferase/NUDIX hydrolase n=1 Tax=Streptomyces nitrosporeus TaxID=28894 RepID=UPI0019B0DE45|nr:NUDIX domain-containing protein [Streptomyces nitrosporeus]GGZ22072.1 hypothetical protein GCM10010327_61340 [Streptomyces nitrosporeus]